MKSLNRSRIRKMIIKEMSMGLSPDTSNVGKFYALIYVPYEGMSLYEGNSVEELEAFYESYMSHGELSAIFQASVIKGDIRKAADQIY